MFVLVCLTCPITSKDPYHDSFDEMRNYNTKNTDRGEKRGANEYYIINSPPFKKPEEGGKILINVSF